MEATIGIIQVGEGEHCCLSEINPAVHESFDVRVSGDAYDICQCRLDKKAPFRSVLGVSEDLRALRGVDEVHEYLTFDIIVEHDHSSVQFAGLCTIFFRTGNVVVKEFSSGDGGEHTRC